MAIGGFNFPNLVSPSNGIIKMRALRKLDEMEREIQHLQTGVRQARAALAHGDDKSLASALTNTRNWLFSLTESVAYISAILRPQEGLGLGIHFAGMSLDRAFKLGAERGRLDGRA